MNLGYTYNAFRFGSDITPIKEKTGYDIIKEECEDVDILKSRNLLFTKFKENVIYLPKYLIDSNTLFSNIISYSISDIYRLKLNSYKYIIKQNKYKSILGLNFLLLPIACFWWQIIFMFIFVLLVGIFIQFRIYKSFKNDILSTVDSLLKYKKINELEKNIGYEIANNYSFWAAIWVYSPLIKLFHWLLKGKRIK